MYYVCFYSVSILKSIVFLIGYQPAWANLVIVICKIHYQSTSNNNIFKPQIFSDMLQFCNTSLSYCGGLLHGVRGKQEHKAQKKVFVEIQASIYSKYSQPHAAFT